MKTVVVSDLHLGNRHAAADRFCDWLARLPEAAALVLNGDVIDRRRVALSGVHAAALHALRERSRVSRVVWIRGNHDETYMMDDPAGITFHGEFTVGRRLFMAHGHDFDNVMPYNRPFMLLFKALHRLRVSLGAESVHVARYAKRFPTLYRMLRRSVMMNAVEHARESGFEAVACGHTHYAEDLDVGGVRYLNTGSWTEAPHHMIVIDDARIRWLPWDAAV